MLMVPFGLIQGSYVLVVRPSGSSCCVVQNWSRPTVEFFGMSVSAPRSILVQPDWSKFVDITVAGESATLYVIPHCVTARLVTLEGPRSFSTITEDLAASLAGLCLTRGSEFTFDGSRYVVQGGEADGGWRGFVICDHRTKVQLNHICSTHTMQEEVADLTHSIASLLKSGGNVLVHGSTGCGKHRAVLAAISLVRFDLVEWPRKEKCGSRKCALLISDLEHVFPASDVSTCALSAERLAQSCCDRVIAITSRRSKISEAMAASTFSFDIHVQKPSLLQRETYFRRHFPTWTGSQVLSAAKVSVGMSLVELQRKGEMLTFEVLPDLDNIVGLDDAHEELMSVIVMPRLYPAAFKRMGVNPAKGVLLYGPPGCGKTTLVRELSKRPEFSFHYLDCASVLSSYVGDAERTLRDVFDAARAASPALIFFDEVECIGRRRRSEGADTDRLLSTLLGEMDGLRALDDVSFVGATNLPHLIDEALLRPGRFDRCVAVPPPSLDQRRRVVAKILSESGLSDEGINVAAIAMEGFTTADVMHVCRCAAIESRGSVTDETLRNAALAATPTTVESVIYDAFRDARDV